LTTLQSLHVVLLNVECTASLTQRTTNGYDWTPIYTSSRIRDIAASAIRMISLKFIIGYP